MLKTSHFIGETCCKNKVGSQHCDLHSSALFISWKFRPSHNITLPLAALSPPEMWLSLHIFLLPYSIFQGGCHTGIGKRGRMGHPHQCSPFSPFFHFQCNIHPIHTVLFHILCSQLWVWKGEMNDFASGTRKAKKTKHLNDFNFEATVECSISS